MKNKLICCFCLTIFLSPFFQNVFFRYISWGIGQRLGPHDLLRQLRSSLSIRQLGHDRSHGSAKGPGLQVPGSAGRQGMLVGLRVKALWERNHGWYSPKHGKDLDLTDLSMKKLDLTIDFAVMKRDRNHYKWWFNHWAWGYFFQQTDCWYFVIKLWVSQLVLDSFIDWAWVS